VSTSTVSASASASVPPLQAPASLSPLAFLRSGWSHRRLIGQLARRRIEERYRGSILGRAWALLNPLLLLAVYTFVFSVVFQAKWGLRQGGSVEFALFLFSGLIVYTVFSECVNEAPLLLRRNEIYIKQMVFPVEVLPWVGLTSALFHFAMGFVMLMGLHAWVRGVPPATALYLPLVLLPVPLLTLGATWWLSSLGIFLRDLSQVVGLSTTALLFLSPIFYPADRVPEAIRPAYELNPFAPVLEASKDVLFRGVTPDWAPLAGILIGAWLLAWSGYVWFMKTKKSFADVL